MSLNGISELPNKKDRQQAKLDIAQAKRQGKTVAPDGTISGSIDSTKPYYRENNVYDLTSLPTTYGNTNTDPYVNNPNTEGLLIARPWTGVIPIAAPTTIEEALPAATLIDLQVWFDGADTNTYVPNATDEQTITQWEDKSNFARNANPSGGATTRPSYENTVLQNGNGYLEFDGGDTLTVNPFAALISQTGFSVFVVAKAANTTGLKYLIETNQNDLRISFNNTEVVTGMSTSTETSSGLGFNTAWHVHTFIFDGSGAPDPAATNLYRYDSVGIVRTGSGTGPATTSASNNTLYIGNRSTGGAGWNGFIGEVILFNRTLTSVEYQNVENYLKTKWGI